MSWVYLDDNLPDHPKIVAAGPQSAWLFICGLCYVQRYSTDGIIPMAAAKRLADFTPSVITKAVDGLIAVGLWHLEGDNYAINDWSDWNRTKASRSDLGRRAARARWDAKRNADAYADAMPTHDADASIPHMPGDALSHPHPHPIPTSTSSPSSHPCSEAIEEAMEILAKQRLAEATGVKNPKAWLAKVKRNLAEDGTRDHALEYLSKYELTATQLADVLNGRTNVLRTAPRRAS